MNRSPIALLAGSEFDDAKTDLKGPLADDLTGTLKTVLNNPVLPSEFDLFDTACHQNEGKDTL